jgi:hypothetical protein
MQFILQRVSPAPQQWCVVIYTLLHAEKQHIMSEEISMEHSNSLYVLPAVLTNLVFWQ